MAKDTVERILEQVRAAAPDLPEATLGKIARGIHADLGGGAHYVAKAPTAGKVYRLGEAVAAGAPLAEAFASVGISASYGYRLLGRSWRFRRA